MVLHPVGQQPSPVYWRRRIAALAVLGLLLWFGLQACGGGDDGSGARNEISTDDTPTATPTATTTVTASPSASAAAAPAPKPTPLVVPVCTDRDVAVTVTTDARNYAAGTTPKFTMTIANTGRQPCRRDVGSRALELIVTSGPARVWTSDLCKPGGTSNVTTLAPGQKVATSLAWPRVRRPANCSINPAIAEPGMYVVTGRAGEAVSQKAVFALR